VDQGTGVPPKTKAKEGNPASIENEKTGYAENVDWLIELFTTAVAKYEDPKTISKTTSVDPRPTTRSAPLPQW
jgi:hypothetical protein